jgi:hypothetical protein
MIALPTRMVGLFNFLLLGHAPFWDSEFDGWSRAAVVVRGAAEAAHDVAAGDDRYQSWRLIVRHNWQATDVVIGHVVGRLPDRGIGVNELRQQLHDFADGGARRNVFV